MASVYRAPESILGELGIREPRDIHIEAIAEYCGATILYQPLEGSEARILGYRDRAIITVNSAAPLGRRRFSAGHELGHWMCDRGKIAFSCTENMLAREWADDNPEVRANQFSAELLLPQPMFVATAKNLEMTFATVRQLSETFQTSLTATAIRLVEFGSFPAMVICSDAERRRWFRRGPDVPGVLWPHERVSRLTMAHDVLSGMATPPGPTDVSADAWFGHRDARRYAIREDSIRITRDLVLTLLWWKDETQLLDLEDDDNESED
ncbi:MAG: ImmA/IrrE family metallo-endopeptidase [Candidatus Rokuibacteriota bacterium]|nr:MAG: ImmA/IrrE family metallo-endopeptidase [Candidatus Rokubacteria bacterium]